MSMVGEGSCDLEEVFLALRFNALPIELDELLSSERPRLVRLCARLTGDLQAAQDLAQETLIIAWRNAHQLREPERYSQWLSGIARNLCRNWVRSRRRESARFEV